MKYDKNSLIGFLLIFIVLMVFNTFFFPEPEIKSNQTSIPKKEIEVIQDDVNVDTLKIEQKIIDTSIVSEQLRVKYGEFAKNAIGEQKEIVLENDKLRIYLSNLGGKISSVIVKEGHVPGKVLKTYDKKELRLFDQDSSDFNIQVPISGNLINTNELFFTVENENSNQVIMRLYANEGSYLEFSYTLKAEQENGYLIDLDINLVGLDYIIPSGRGVEMEWKMKTPKPKRVQKIKIEILVFIIKKRRQET